MTSTHLTLLCIGGCISVNAEAYDSRSSDIPRPRVSNEDDETPSPEDVHMVMGYELQKLNRASEAADRFRAAVALNPQNADAYALLGFSLAHELQITGISLR